MATNTTNLGILSKANIRLCRLRLWSNFQGFGFHLEPSLGPPYLRCMVESNSPAAAGGLKIRDVILAVNDHDMLEEDFSRVQAAIQFASYGKTRVDLLVVNQNYYEIIKANKMHINSTSVTVIDTPTTMPADFVNVPKFTRRVCDMCFDRNDTAFGFDVANGTANIGVYVHKVFPNSPASITGLRASDRIIEINSQYVDEKSSESIRKKLDKAKKKGALQLLVVDTQTYKYYKDNHIKLSSNHLEKTNDPIAKKPIQIQKNGSYVSAYNGTIQVCHEDLTELQVDAIVVASTSDRLIASVLQKAGNAVTTAYESEKNRKSNASICTDGGNLACKRIYFIPCSQMSKSADKCVFRNFVLEAVILAVNDHTIIIRSIAFPAIGCGQYHCDLNFVAKTLVMTAAYELEHQPSLALHISFVIQQQQNNVFDVFRDELKTFKKKISPYTRDRLSAIKTFLLSDGSRHDENVNEFDVEKRLVDRSSSQFTMVVNEFRATMTSQICREIVRVEMIRNKRWYRQYATHRDEFSQRLKEDTEERLFHGCSESAANNIIKDGFNRSYAGQHGALYGNGVYFSSKASYSHSYAIPNANGERCMFLARVLIGKTTVGNSSTKVCPIGYDTTTDGSHIFVTYHDAQAFGEYLITYK